MSLSLVVMAAGIGSRFGGDKQIVPIGPDGETFLDFAIVDAVAAGVERVVLVVRSDIEDELRRHVAGRHPDLDVAYVCQDRHGPARAKPWGTGQAILVAAPEVDGAFIACNADDYYGTSTYAAIAAAARNLPADRALLAGFRLDRTLPAEGEVSRGICEVADGELVALVETHGIGRRADGAITAIDPPGPLTDDTVTSMNLWAFPHRLFADLEQGFEAFLAAHGDEEKSEYLLPAVVHELRAAGELSVGVVTTDEPWVGVTNPADLEVARRRIAEVRG